MISETILVTGAPRSGTTPMGDVLRRLPGAVSLYEPMGLSGDRRITVRMPMPGEPDFSEAQFEEFLSDMRRIRLKYHRQGRPIEQVGHVRAVATRVVGTRAPISHRVAKLTPGKKTLVWKDPLAVFCTRHGKSHGFRSVVTVRPPLASAASYKRLLWLPKIRKIYGRYAAQLGPVPEVASRLDELEANPVGASALLWHLIHRFLLEVSAEEATSVHFFAPQVRDQSDREGYESLFDWLGHPMPSTVARSLEERAMMGDATAPIGRQVHDWNRTSQQANSYWSSVLSEDDVRLVSDINDGLWKSLQTSIRDHRL